MKKKILTAIMAITLSFVLAACGSSAAQGGNNNSSQDTESQQSADTSASQNKTTGEDGSDSTEETEKRVALDGAEIQTEDPSMPTRVPMEGGTKINMYFGDTLIPGVLNDSETAKALIEKLPYTQHVSRYSHDFCGVTEDLPYKEEEVHYGWLNGDIDFAIDAPYFTILFEDEDVSEQYGYQVNIGVITCPLSEIAALEGSYDVRIELAEDAEQTKEGTTAAPADAQQTDAGNTAAPADTQQTDEGNTAAPADAQQTNEGAADSSADTQQMKHGSTAPTANEQQTEKGEPAMSAYTYKKQEIMVQKGDASIYGIAYVPETDKKVPLVIFSHELGNDHTSGERYAERLAEAGYAAYIFDFCGGTVGGNKSSGSNSDMSILTEAADLEAVLASAKTWDFADPDRIVLMGGSMGGLVTTVVGSGHQDEIAGMILMYPALSAKEDSGMEQYPTKEDVPDDVSLFGGWIHVGKNYITDLWDVDFNQLLSSCRVPLLLLHGERDSTVPLSWSEEARKIIPDCEFHVIKDGGHEFFGQPFEDAMSFILPYLNRQVNESKEENPEPATETTSDNKENEMLQMTIGETPVEVDWQENSAVEALKDLCRENPLQIQMSMYGGFEQVGSIGQSLPTEDQQTTTRSGDIVLYSGSQIVVFYGSNSWAYTRLGHISDKTDQEMKELLGNGEVTITLTSN